MSCSGTPDCLCGCCAGTSVQTPQVASNSPGLPAVAYRAGTWATFKESMLARLSSSDYPALGALKTRSDDDFTVALLDATSVMLDILTFYQERLANESYLRTAQQLRSLVELSRLIGYQPSPGVSASTYVAFTLQTAPGQAPDPTAPAITIPAGTQIQSVPTQNQKPQTFETSADIPAKADWNALAVQTGQPWSPQFGDTSVYLQGTATQLQPGDLILIVGDERLHSAGSLRWDVRLVTKVQPDAQQRRTYVEWSEGLGGGSTPPAQKHPKFYAFRQRAALFGYTALNPLLLTSDTISNLTKAQLLSGTDWNFSIHDLAGSGLIDLDAIYSKIVTSGWVALIVPDARVSRSPAGFVSLYGVTAVTAVSRSDFGMSSKISRLTADTGANLAGYYGATRSTSVLAQSEELPAAEQPLDHPLYGSNIDLESLRPDLLGATVVAISGARQKLVLMNGATFRPDDPNAQPAHLDPGAIVTVTSPASLPLAGGAIPDWVTSTDPRTLSVEDSQGRPGTVRAALSEFRLAPSAASDPEASEIVLVQSVDTVAEPFAHTRLRLKSGLLNCYDRATASVNANVGLATHGASVTEILGSGSASTPNQSFTLKQSPLTYVQAVTPSGRQSTLQVQASGAKWAPVPTLFGQGPSSQVFAALNPPGGATKVLFGDGEEGATLPTGQNNIIANYRVGLGAAGNVATGALSTLIDRPLGVNGATNPTPATGGQDPDSVDGIRSNAPQTVLTLGRAVSVEDYQSFAATFAGIAKAYALWIPSGPARGVFLTVAGAGGAALPPGNPTLSNLVSALRGFGNPLVPITAQSFLETLFGLSANLAHDPAFDRGAVEAAVRQALTATYCFAQRTFGQGVTADEVSTVIQNVPGVVAVNVTGLTALETSAGGDLASAGFTLSNYSAWLAQRLKTPLPRSVTPTRICPYVPVASTQGLPLPAEILVLHPDPNQVSLGVMS